MAAERSKRRNAKNGKFVGDGPRAIEERRAKVHAMALSGMQFRDIAAKLGISLGLAYSDYKYVHDETIREANETAEQQRQKSVERIDRAIRGLLSKVDSGSARHAEVLARLEQERARLLGLYAPEKRQHDVSGSLAEFLSLGFGEDSEEGSEPVAE